MKALFISNDPTIFDPESFARARMREYAKTIGELHILSRAPKNEDTQEGALYLHGLHPLPTRLGRALFFHTLARRARALAREHRIEVVSAQDPFEHGAVAKYAVHGTSIKLHIQVHTDFCSPYFLQESHKNRVRVHIADTVLPTANGIRTVSDRIKKTLLARYGSRIVEPSVIPIAVASLAPSTPPPAPYAPFPTPFPFVLMVVGRLEKEKNVSDVLYAVEQLTKEQYPITLAVVGDGSKKAALKALASKLGITEHVVFLGTRKDVKALLLHAHAFIQASTHEGYGRTYLEAALAKLPMVVTDAGIVGEVFVQDKSALVCSVGDIECLTRSVANIIEDQGLRVSLRENAWEAAQKHIAQIGNIPQRIAEDMAHTITRAQTSSTASI